VITPLFSAASKKPLYEQLYVSIVRDIETGALGRGARLPSKRKLAVHANISQSTVENAYAQLKAEGYIESRPKRGYFVARLTPAAQPAQTRREPTPPAPPDAPLCRFDLRTNAVDAELFPFSIWNRLLRGCQQDDRTSLLAPIHPQGNADLREEIVRYLRAFRGLEARADQVVLGAGMEYLLGLLLELMPDAPVAFENPGYPQAARILTARRRPMFPIPLDGEGLCAGALADTDASVALVTPSHHFPLGITMSIGRRRQLLQWTAGRADRYLIEDDFDGEFRFVLRPIPTLYSLDGGGRVIYMNSFARTLSPSLRIAYMVLPETLLLRYREMLSFYSCTVSEFEQRIIRSFFQGGHYERHLNRMRLVYKKKRDALLEGLSPLGSALSIDGPNAGLHLLLRVRGLNEAALVARAAARDVRVYPLSHYHWGPPPPSHTVVAGYAGHTADTLRQAARRLVEAWG
jgi:GntR family transcriptional regulator/MocR family aminotransferase